MSDRKIITYAIACVLIVAIAVSGGVYSCSVINTGYYEFAEKCIASGGTLVPQGQYDVLCLGAARK